MVNVALVDEHGATVEERIEVYRGPYEDPCVMIDRLVPPDREDEFPFLRSIDPYGDTVFNQMQMDRFLSEWEYLEGAN